MNHIFTTKNMFIIMREFIVFPSDSLLHYAVIITNKENNKIFEKKNFFFLIKGGG